MPLWGQRLYCCILKAKRGFPYNAGDSRCYLLREDHLSLVTLDHAREIQTPKGMRKVLTNALSAPGELSLEVKKFRVQKRDVYLLCSDGLYDNVTTELIQETLNSLSLQSGLDSLTSHILSKEADDNLTAVIVEI